MISHSQNTNDSSTEEETVQNDCFRMTVSQDEDDFDQESSDELEDDQRSSGDDLDQFDDQVEAPESDTDNSSIPLLDFGDFQQRPEVKEFLKKMYDATVNKGPSVVQEQARAVNNIKLQINSTTTQPKQTSTKRGKDDKQLTGISTPNNVPKIKSPSDTTLYRPALKQKRVENTTQSPESVTKLLQLSKQRNGEEEVNNLLNKVRLSSFPTDRTPNRVQPVTGAAAASTSYAQQQESSSQQDEFREQQAKARRIAERAVLEAERHKAQVAAPAGMSLTNEINQNRMNQNPTVVIPEIQKQSELGVPAVDYNFNDDNPNNFCQVSNHLDSASEIKIAKGGFLELPKIAPPKGLKTNDQDNK